MTSSLATLSDALFTAILHSTWQGCVLALAFLVVSPRLHSSQSRYRLAMGLFLATILAFVGTFVYAMPDTPVAGLAVTGVQGPSLATVFAIAWCAGASFVGGRYFFGWLWLRVVIVGQSIPVPATIEALFDETRLRLNAPRRVRVRASELIRSPMVTGVVRPVVLLPVSLLSGVPSSVLTAVFVHELSHVRRLDHVAVFVQAVGETLLFYHPAVRWLSAECRRHREYRCDDESISQLGNRYDYARALLSMEESSGDPRVPALLMNGDELMNRVERILGDETRPGTSRSWMSGLLGLAVIGLLAYSLSYGMETEDGGLQAHRHTLSIDWLPPAVTQWSELVEAAAQRHDVSANVLALMLLVESNGDRQAESSSGARGLMQVMPRTGAAIAEQRGLTDFETSELFDAETSIDFGAWYLAQMMERFADEPGRAEELAITAYNAGPGSIDAYLSGSKPLSTESAGYRDLMLSLLSEADEDRSLVLDGRRDEFRRRLPAFQAPVDGKVSSHFGHEAGSKGVHKGVDIVAPLGTSVTAPAGGQVTAVGEDEKRGKYITVRHVYGVESRYYHLSGVAVSVGEDLEAGDALGAVGSTGKSTGPHLHFEVRELGEPVSPSLYGLVLE